LLTEEAQVLAVTSSLAVLDCLQHQIKILEQSVQKRLRHTPSYEQLLTVAGIGPILAQTIALETGAISRFPSVGHYASYCRCVDSNKLSNGKRKGTGNVKNGNPYWKRNKKVAVSAVMICSPIRGTLEGALTSSKTTSQRSKARD